MEGYNVEKNSKAEILRYAGIASERLLEENPEKIDRLETEKKRIEEALDMTSEEIIVEAKRILLD